MIKPCPECKKEISDSSFSCPHCGKEFVTDICLKGLLFYGILFVILLAYSMTKPSTIIDENVLLDNLKASYEKEFNEAGIEKKGALSPLSTE
jgi:hypothetical protein